MTPAALVWVRERVEMTLRRWLRRPDVPLTAPPPLPTALVPEQPAPATWLEALVWDVAADTGEFTLILKDGADVILAVSPAKWPS